MKKIILMMLTVLFISCGRKITDRFIFTADSEFSYTLRTYAYLNVKIISKNSNGKLIRYWKNLSDENWCGFRSDTIIISKDKQTIRETFETYDTWSKLVFIPDEDNLNNEKIEIITSVTDLQPNTSPRMRAEKLKERMNQRKEREEREER